MNWFLVLAFLFFMGSVAGWIMELFYRKFFSDANPERKWINPGLCTGPYLPIYGTGLCCVFLIASLERYISVDNMIVSKIIIMIIMAFAMTAIEYVAGIWCLKIFQLRLWDYRNEWGNIQGIICPKFSLYWGLLGGMYYILIHPYIINAVIWLSNNLAFSFVIGMFFGIFIIDFAEATSLVVKFRSFARENGVVLRYEAVKVHIRKKYEEAEKKYHMFKPFQTELPIKEHLKDMLESFESRIKRK